MCILDGSKLLMKGGIVEKVTWCCWYGVGVVGVAGMGLE